MNVGEAYSEPEVGSGKTEGSMGDFGTFKLDPAGRKSVDCKTLPTQPSTVHKQLHKPRHTVDFVTSPLNIRWNQ